MKKPLILFYDVETILMQAYVFSLGKQVLRHSQLVPGANKFGIICISYCFNDGPIKSIVWTPEGGMKKMISEFDKIIKRADHVIGKNSDRFDNKMINAVRALEGLPGYPDWIKYADDLEKQMRKYFRLPSQSLDYLSEQLGLGGKVRMEFSDWTNISQYMELKTLELTLNKEVTNKSCHPQFLDIFTKQRFKTKSTKVRQVGKKALDKMVFYNKKDVEDTRTLWNKLKGHFEPRFNMATFTNQSLACRHCGSTNVMPNGSSISNKMRWKKYTCKDCYSYAGRLPMDSVTKVRSRLG